MTCSSPPSTLSCHNQITCFLFVQSSHNINRKICKWEEVNYKSACFKTESRSSSTSWGSLLFAEWKRTKRKTQYLIWPDRRGASLLIFVYYFLFLCTVWRRRWRLTYQKSALSLPFKWTCNYLTITHERDRPHKKTTYIYLRSGDCAL